MLGLRSVAGSRAAEIVAAWVCSLGACALVASALGACQAFDPSKLDIRLSPIDMPGDIDAGRDTGVDDPACTMPVAELCNGVDDDCDEKIDENADAACAEPQSTSVCATGGRCIVVSCDPGYVDCNASAYDGCEHLAADGPCPDSCEELCPDAGSDAGQDAAVEDAAVEDAAVEDATVEDAAVDAGETCDELPEACDGLDNDCDDAIDETEQCAIERCVATTPSYRGGECDRCVCEKCGTQRANCQEHPDMTWRQQCRAVLECYVIEDRAGNCGGNADCYASGACSAEINIAAGGADGDDASGAIGGNCTWVNPPTYACMGATGYRDQCTLALCATECAD